MAVMRGRKPSFQLSTVAGQYWLKLFLPTACVQRLMTLTCKSKPRLASRERCDAEYELFYVTLA